MERVVRAVEWEEELVQYKDGSTNQERYIMALAELWERWMREWTLPDFAQSVTDLRAGNYVVVLERVLSAIPERIMQLKGFWLGLWYGANPEWRGAERSIFGPPGVHLLSPEERIGGALHRMLLSLKAITEEVK